MTGAHGLGRPRRLDSHSQDSRDPGGVVAGGMEARVKELLGRLAQLVPEDIAWELGVHFRASSETIAEYAVRVEALESENRQLQERLDRGKEEFVQLRESMSELLNLHDLSEAISTSLDIGDILAALMALSGRFVEYESCGVFVLEGEGDRLQAMALRGDGGESALKARIRGHWDDGIIDWVLREGRPVVIDDMDSLIHNQRADRCLVIIPLMVRGKKVGIFTLFCHRAKDDFTLGELELLGMLASQTAAAIENSRLYTELESAHRGLQDSQRQLLISVKQAAVGELAGGVAHEVNNPLQIILSRVQLMTAQHRESPKLVEGLGLIENNVKRISKIIRALLGFASNSAAKTQWAPLDLSQAIHRSVELLDHQLSGQLIDIQLEIGEDLPQLSGNVGELEQVFINLILNAQNAMAKGGRLRITAAFDGEDSIVVRFADTGVGIEPEHIDRIFEPFFTTHTDDGGTGLGLAVSYRIVESHKGSLTVESTPGEGSTFIIRLPVANPEVEGADEANSIVPQSASST